MGSSSAGNYHAAPGGDLDAAEAGIAFGKEVRGIRLTTYLDDVRGTATGDTSFTSTLTEVTISGDIPAVPEPSALAFAAKGLAFLFQRRRA